MQGVEQEVWLQLALQHLQMRLGQLNLKLGCANLPFPQSLVIRDCIADEDNRHICIGDIVEHAGDVEGPELWPMNSEGVSSGVPNRGGPLMQLLIPDCIGC